MIKLVKNELGEVVAFGSDDGYEPHIPDGFTLELVESYKPKQESPSIVTMRQARLALLQSGLLSTVNAAISSGGDADKIEWEYAADVDRNSPLVQNMKAGLSLTEDDLDSLFILAATL